MKKAFVLLVILVLLIASTGCFWDYMESNTEQPLFGVWGTNHDDMFAVGGWAWPSPPLFVPIITHYDGTAWSEMTFPTGQFVFRGVWGTEHDDVLDVFAVGGGGLEKYGVVYHYDGEVWSDMGGDHPKWLRGVWGTAWNNVWAVGGDQFVGMVIEHYDGSEWSIIESLDMGFGLTDVWGTAHDNVWAVGEKGAILHYDGSGWTLVLPFITTVDLYGVHGYSSTKVFAVGEGGTIMRYDGTNWSQVESGTTRTLRDVDSCWIVGEGGTILWYTSDEWGPYPVTPTTETLHGVWRQSVGTNWACAVGLEGTIIDWPRAAPTSESEGMGMGLKSSGLLASNSILSAETATLGDHITMTLDVGVTDLPVTVEDSLPDELSYIPDTLVVSGGEADCETSEHEIVCVLEEVESYMITFDVQVTRASGYVGAGKWYSPQDLEGEDIVVENTVTIGSETTTETLTITPFDGFYKLYGNAWYLDEDGADVDIDDPLNVPTNADVHWAIGLLVYNSPGDAISEMAGVNIKDRLGNELELDETVIAIWDGKKLDYDHDTAPAKLSGKTAQVKLSWKDIPLLADGYIFAPKLEISTDIDPKMGQQEFADEVLTEHELNSGAVLKFVDPETGLHLRADIPPIVVTADPDWGE